MTGYAHETVMLEECVEALQPRDGGVYVDCTLGGGGHTERILAAADCRVIGLDRDPAALAAAAARIGSDRLVPVHARFSEIGEVLARLGIDAVDGILADLGVSSHQLDTADRGFSFRFSGPIDMRMDPTSGSPASVLVNELSESELADLIFHFGEDRLARRIAKTIVTGRPWSDTLVLANAISAAVPPPARRGRIHPATRTFQALRIAVNEELVELQALLDASVGTLKPGGRVAILSFHSLEDRMVKQFFADRSGKTAPRDPWGNPVGPVHLKVLPPRTPSPEDDNPRARSARLRVAERLPWNAP
ncbi:MAG: 16S rRNA (cytosine(1402)-N(4))-methyltransferase RsmH [Alphaproteobacteria bacterium]|nr:16S rRNA (cytosine(1402)-N(4))-methyltransferase RsmH [Alphaproteobacteria bacterium]